jgi:ATP-dependent DNA helicase RecG
MSGRPELLYPLFSELTAIKGLGPVAAAALATMGIHRPRDLVFTLPAGVTDRRLKASVLDAPLPGVVTVEVTIGRHHPGQTKAQPVRISAEDSRTTFQIVLFHVKGDWAMTQFPPGARRIVSGRAEVFDGMVRMTHPDLVLDPGEAASLPAFEPVYPLAQGLTRKTMARAVRGALALAPGLDEWIEPETLRRRGWPAWREALEQAHAPDGNAAVERGHPARERLAYDELFAHQLTLAIARARFRRPKGFVTKGDGRLTAALTAALPYALTGAQQRAIGEIRADMAAAGRMNRLLQGDVGSGKTVVALAAMLTAAEAGGQAALMAPTEILARQHFERLAPLAEAAGVRMDILTGRDRGAERTAKLASLASGETRLITGTHALFQDEVAFHDLRLAVIDEQHRFGVIQRRDLGGKGRAPDMLVMTATPIPRSLALSAWGGLDLSLLDEKPPGRGLVRTVLVSASRMDEVLARLRAALAEGRQAYWVCPLVAESEALDLAAAEARWQDLKAALAPAAVGLIHGQMSAEDKDDAMAAFVAGATRLLVATTIVEVGVDVANASIMVIEGAEHFGLSQLHQLRGRVGRGAAASTCLLLYNPTLGDAALARLNVMRETDNGFRIAEEDLRQRGAGDLLGAQQSGLPKFRIADLETQGSLLALAHDDARLLVAADPKLQSPRGLAATVLLFLMDKDRDVLFLHSG